MTLRIQDKKFYDRVSFKYDLAHIPDFNSLIAISQELSKPVFELNEEDFKNKNLVGATSDTMKQKVEEFKNIFDDLGERVRFLTS